jgi:putative flippase GtrA
MIIKKYIQDLITPQFGRFLMVGGTAAFANFSSRFLFRPYTSFVMSVALAYIVGTLISFYLNKHFTFSSHDEKTELQFAKFLLMASLSIVIASGVAKLCMITYDFTNFSYIDRKLMESVAHIIAIGFTTLFNFFSMKYFSFKKIQ